jgi:glycerol-3-phosphate dehydrogenase
MAFARRGSARSHLSRRPFDLIVIGTGINGAGIARDAALRGLSVLLLDKSGIGSGTTSWATRLIHGGLRYLEHYEIPLVRESLRERAILLRIAPHLVRPLPFLLPIYRGDKRGPTIIRLGMLAYDALSVAQPPLQRHRMLGREETLRREPGLEPSGLRGAALYYDAQLEFPERLTLENALAARDQGAVVLTYSRVDRLLRADNTVQGVAFTDVLEGTEHQAMGAVIINATGPWADELLPGKPLIGGTKGSHIVVNPFPGAPREVLYVEARDNHRPYFIVPWNGLYLIGTTDVRYHGDLDRVVAGEDEIDYLLRETNRVIPAANLARQNILYTYAGVRPLPYQPKGVEGAITRRHIVHDHAPKIEGLITIIGGKLTTYRNLAKQAVDLAYRKLGRTLPRCPTAAIPLPGAITVDFSAFASSFQQTSGLPASITQRLLRIYGVRAPHVVELAAGRSDLLAPMDNSAAIGAEVLFSFQYELAETLTDALARCTMLTWEPAMGIGADVAAAELGVRYLGWDEQRAEREVAAYRTSIERYSPLACLTPNSAGED